MAGSIAERIDEFMAETDVGCLFSAVAKKLFTF